MENDIELDLIIKLIKELREDAMNDSKSQASGYALQLIQTYDVLLYKITEDKKVA